MKRIIAIALVPTLTACGSLGPEYVSKIGEQSSFTSTTQPLSDQDNDGFSIKEGDCDDNEPTVYPGATEYCDGIDSDCSGSESSGIVSFYNTVENKWYNRTNNLKGDINAPATQNLSDPGSYHFCDGTFYVNLTVSADLDIYGQLGEVFLHGGQTGQIINNENGHDLTIQNLTLTNGIKLDGFGGGLHQSGGTLSITDVNFTSNRAQTGGAISVSSAFTTLENVNFYDNTAELGGAVDVYYGSYTSNNNNYTANTALLRGAGLFSSFAEINETTPHYEENYAAEMGGAVYAYETVHTAQNNGERTLSGPNCTFINNQAPLGGVWHGLTSTLGLTDCNLSDEGSPEDNSPHDISIEDNGFLYNYEGEITVVCDQSGCGDVTEFSLEAKKAIEYGISPVAIIGNVYLSQTIDTIDTFSYYTKSDTVCTPTFTVHEKTADSDWTIIWEGQGGMTSALDYAYVSAGNVGIPTVPGNEYILGISNGDSCGLLLFYWGGATDPYVTGFGDLTGYAYQTSWDTKKYISTYKGGLYTSTVTTSH